jgi:hypothetical protein
MDDNDSDSDSADRDRTVGPQLVPTEDQVKLRRRYGRMIGWYGAIAFLFLSLSAYNVIKGLNSFGSIPMFVELGIGIALVIPAVWASRRRAKLDANIAADSKLLPRHLKTWQHLLMLLIVVPAVLFAVSWLVVTLLVAATAPSEEDMRSQEVDRIREITTSTLNNSKQTVIENFCQNMVDPGKRGKLRQSIGQGPGFSVTYLTQDEAAQIQFETLLAYCGLSQ